MDKDPKSAPISSKQPMTRTQAAYLKTLSVEAGEPFDATLSVAAATKRIELLQQRLGRKPKVILRDEQTDG